MFRQIINNALFRFALLLVALGHAIGFAGHLMGA